MESTLKSTSLSNKVNNIVIEDISSEVGDGSRADDPTIKWVEISSADDTYMNDAGALFENEIKKVLIKFSFIKFNTEIAARYAKVKDGGKEDIFQFGTKNFNIFQTTDLREKFENIHNNIDQP